MKIDNDENNGRPVNRVLGAYYHEFEPNDVATISYVGSPHLLALQGDRDGVRMADIANPENTVVVAITVGRLSCRPGLPPFNHLIYYDANSNPPSYYCFHGTHEPLTARDRAMIDRKLSDPSWIDKQLNELEEE